MAKEDHIEMEGTVVENFTEYHVQSRIRKRTRGHSAHLRPYEKELHSHTYRR